ncbi:MAG: putative phage abortive infection protein [Pseudomonadota bacterium]
MTKKRDTVTKEHKPEDDDNNNNGYDNKIFWIVFVPIIAIFLIYLTSLLFAIWPIDTKTIAQSGLFGDSFGVLTALFSGLAFGGLLVTIYYQKRDLGLTQQELKDTRHQMQRQQRENNIFNLLRVHSDLVSQLDIKKRDDSSTDIHTGRDCFIYYHRELYKRYNSDIKGTPVEKIKTAYDSFWSKSRQDLGHYFRTLYNIFKFLRDPDFSISERKLYANIVRGQLSDYELSMLFYNCLTEYGNKFIILTEEFALFDNLPVDLVFEHELLCYIPQKAFGDNKAALDLMSELCA